jgi:hypothetical protein
VPENTHENSPPEIFEKKPVTADTKKSEKVLISLGDFQKKNSHRSKVIVK